MKKKLVFVAMLTVLLAFSFMSCQEVDEGDDGVQKTLIVNGITGFTGDPLLTVALAHINKKDETELDAYNQATYAASITIPLVSYRVKGQIFTGTGPFYIILYIDANGTPSDLNDDESWYYTGGGLQPIPYTISEATTTIEFSKFAKK